MANLVDRLVEARAAARATTSPQVVQASITHAEFGRVALRFEQGEDGLSVSMSSADPTFAGAAQAALASARPVTAGTSADAGTNSNNPSANQQQAQQQSQQSAQQSAQQSGRDTNSALAANANASFAGQMGQSANQNGQSSANQQQQRADNIADNTTPLSASDTPAPEAAGIFA